jgi:hypothetical protein
MREDTKLAKIRKAMRDENWDEALRLAARFQRLGEQAEAIKRAANAMTNPAFYEGLGYNLAQVRTDGIAALKERYSESWGVAKEKKAESGEPTQ